MGWRDLFKSKSIVIPKPDPRLRWFGKLPTYGDYYTSALPGDWALQFNDWIIKGYEQYLIRSQELGSKPAKLPRSLFVLRMPRGEHTVIGLMDDYGGDNRGRTFPICFYVSAPTVHFPGPTSATLGVIKPVFEDLLALEKDIANFFRVPGRFDSVFGGRELRLPELPSAAPDASWKDAAGEISLGDWLGRANGKLTDPTGRWFERVRNFGRGIVEYAQTQEDFEPTLRFPLVADIPPLTQACAWLRWLERRMPMEERYVSLCIPVNTAAPTAKMTIVARPPVPEDFQLLADKIDAPAYVDDLSKLAPRGNGNSKEPADEQVEVPGGSLLVYVEH